MWAKPYWAAFWQLLQNLADWLGTLLYLEEFFAGFMMQHNAMQNINTPACVGNFYAVRSVVDRAATASTVLKNKSRISAAPATYLCSHTVLSCSLTLTHAVISCFLAWLSTPQTTVTRQGTEEIWFKKRAAERTRRGSCESVRCADTEEKRIIRLWMTVL